MSAKLFTAGEVGTFRGGSGFPTRYQGGKSGELPFFKVSDMNNPGNKLFMRRANNYISEFQRKAIGAVRIPAGAVVFAKVGAAVFLERKRILAQDSCIDNNMAAFIVDQNRVDVRFAHYLLTAFNMSSLVATTALPSLNSGQLCSMPLLIPENLEEQRRVVNALGEADEMVAALERMITKKQAIKKGLMQQLLTGKTRLSGFTKQWEWRKFDDVMQRINAKRHQILASSYKDVGRLPVIDQGQRPIIGYTDELWVEFNPEEDGVIVFGDHTCITKFVDFPFAVGADGTQIVRALPGNSTRFFAYGLEIEPVVSRGYNRHFKDLREKLLPVPVLAEQTAISHVLGQCELEGNILEDRLTKAYSVKQGMMQELLTGRTRLPVGRAAA